MDQSTYDSDMKNQIKVTNANIFSLSRSTFPLFMFVCRAGMKENLCKDGFTETEFSGALTE